MIQHQDFWSTLALATLLLGYIFLFAIWKFTKKNMVPLVRYLLFFGICYIGTLKSMDFVEGKDLFDKYLVVHFLIMAFFYFIMIGFRLHTEVTYSWRIEKIQNIFNWKRCRLPIEILRKKVEEKNASREILELKNQIDQKEKS